MTFRNLNGTQSAESELVRAVGYYEEALAATPMDPFLHYAVGDLHTRLGQPSEAKLAFAQCLQAATAHGDNDRMRMASEAALRLAHDKETE